MSETSAFPERPKGQPAPTGNKPYPGDGVHGQRSGPTSGRTTSSATAPKDPKPEPGIAPVQPASGSGEEKGAPQGEPGNVYAHAEKQGKADSVFLAVVAVVAVLSAVVLALNGHGESSAAISILSFANVAVGALAGISYQRGRG